MLAWRTLAHMRAFMTITFSMKSRLLSDRKARRWSGWSGTEWFHSWGRLNVERQSCRFDVDLTGMENPVRRIPRHSRKAEGGRRRDEGGGDWDREEGGRKKCPPPEVERERERERERKKERAMAEKNSIKSREMKLGECGRWKLDLRWEFRVDLHRIRSKRIPLILSSLIYLYSYIYIYIYLMDRDIKTILKDHWISHRRYGKRLSLSLSLFQSMVSSLKRVRVKREESSAALCRAPSRGGKGKGRPLGVSTEEREQVGRHPWPEMILFFPTDLMGDSYRIKRERERERKRGGGGGGEICDEDGLKNSAASRQNSANRSARIAPDRSFTIPKRKPNK